MNNELSRINTLSNELYEGTKDFIWAMDNNNNTLQSVYFYVIDFGEKLFEFSTINFITQPITPDIPEFSVTSLWSSQFILISKEILTNVMVHSKATDVQVDIRLLSNKSIVISFKDNGIGFDKESLTRVNGLRNIEKRAQRMNVNITITSKINNGTLIEITI